MKQVLNRFSVFIITVVTVLLSTTSGSVAFASNRTTAIISQHNATVQKGQIVEDVLVVGHDAIISGDVSEILVVIDGNIHLTSTSRTGIVVDLGGSIQEDPGAEVNALYHASLITPFWNGALFGGTFLLLLWVGMLAVSIGLVILASLIAFALRHQIGTPLQYIEGSVRRVGLTGFLISLILLAISAVCAVTMIGLPLTGLLLFLYAVGGIVGFSISSLWLGKLALRNSPTERPVWVLGLIGATIMMTLTNIPFVGFLLFCIFWLIGIGTMTTWLYDLWKARRTRRKLKKS